jgi:diguanylate cyclase (GGDEF)-like protein
MAKILVIDDNPINRKVLAAVLEHAGHRTLEASDGVDGLATVHSSSPQLVISDILMPTMDGYEFVRQLREDPHTTTLPVVFYTAYYHEREAHKLAAECGVERVLAKPASSSEILSTVKQVLECAVVPTAAIEATHTVDEKFDREHLRLVTDKLSESVTELRLANARLAALTDLNTRLASERDPRALLEQVCHGARELIGGSYAVLAVHEPNNPATSNFAVSGLDYKGMVLEPPRVEAGWLAAAFRERQAIRLFEADSHLIGSGLPPGYPPPHALLAAPVCSISRTYGWICIADKVGASGFNADDERILTTLGAQVGRIYENGSLYREVENHAAQLVKEMERRELAAARIQHLNRVYAVSSGINALIVRAQDRQQLLQESCRLAVDQGRFRFAWCGWVDPDGNEGGRATWAGDSDSMASGLREELRDAGAGNSLVREVMKFRSLKICDDLANDSLLTPYRSEITTRGYQSIIALPLLISGKSLGCLILATAEQGFFNADEVRLLTDLAGDISFAFDHIAKTERLNYLAYYDEATGIANRAFFTQRASSYINNASRNGRKLALVVAGLDRFESISDTLGRSATDKLMQDIAKRFAHTVGDSELAARTAPGEFAAILVDIEDDTGVARTLDQWWPQWLGAVFNIETTDLLLTASAGIALCPDDGQCADSLMRHAEVALKRAQQTGERYLFYTQHLGDRRPEKLTLESRLRKGLENEEYLLHYQAKVDAETRRVTGIEALIRWNPREGRLVPPAEFISLMEETGIIVDVGEWVLRQVCSDRARWLELGLKAPRVAANVSTVQLRRKDFVPMIRAVLSAAGENPGLDIEVTESLVMHDAEENIAKLVAVRDLGVNIAIDDFGTGYSSLGRLTQLPIAVLKIDRSFVSSMLEDPSAMTLVSTIISLAHSLRLEVVAEGVESEEQAKLLRLLRCDQMQGYLIGRPRPFDGITTFLSGSRL